MGATKNRSECYGFALGIKLGTSNVHGDPPVSFLASLVQDPGVHEALLPQFSALLFIFVHHFLVHLKITINWVLRGCA